MKRRISLLLVLAMLLSMIPFAAFAEETGEVITSGTAVTASAAEPVTYTWTPTSNGTLTVSMGAASPGWRYTISDAAGNTVGLPKTGSTAKSATFELVGGTTYTYTATGWDSVAYDVTTAAITYTLTFVASEEDGGEVEKAAYEVADTKLALGDNTLTLLDTAVTTIYKFEAPETAVYTFTAPEGAILGYWGAGSWFLSDPKSTTNTYEWTCTGVGQSAYIGVSGVEGAFTLNVEKTADYEVVEIPTVVYENKANLEAFTIPEGAKLGSYVDVFGETHTAVYDSEDGYYHLDSVDGDVLLVDMNYMDIILSAALKSDRPVMYAYTTDENGNDVKYDIGNAVLAYEEVMDADGYYPLTEDLILFYQVYAVGAGTYTFYVTGDYNEECVWMYCMRTMKLAEVEEPSEPDPEPSEPTVSGTVVLNQSVTAESGGKYTYKFAPETDGTLTVTVGDGSTNWVSDVYSFATFKTIASSSGTAAGTYTAELTAGTNYYIRVYASSGALAATPVMAVFMPAGTTEPSEPDPEPSEPDPEPSEPDPEPSEPADPSALISVTNEAVTTSGYVFEYTAATAGTLHVSVGECSPGWRYKVFSPDGVESGYRSKYTAGTECDYYNVAGDWKIVFYAYSSTEADNVDGTVSFTVTFTPDETQPEEPEIQKDPYAVSTTALNVGTNNLTMIDTAEATIFKFKPTETGKYTITGPEGSKIGIWGYSSSYLNDPGSTSNSLVWECADVGPSIFVGVLDAEGQIVVTVEKEAVEPDPEPSEPETEPSVPESSEPETEPTTPVIPDEDVPAGTYYSITVDGNTTYYSSFSASTMNANLKKITGTGYVKLYQDLSLGSSISNTMSFYNGDVTLDLNGHTVTFAVTNVGALYVDGATLTVVDTSAEGTGRVENTNTSGYGIEIWNGTAYLKSGNIYGGSNAVRLYDASDYFYMEGGSLTAQRYAVNAPTGSTAVISGGTLTATLANQYAVYAAGNASVTITGGYFNGTVSGSGLNSKISGGYFIKSVSANYIASGCELQSNNDDVYKYKIVDPNATEEPDVPTEPTEPVKDAYAVSTTTLSVGSNTVSMITTAEATIFKFAPTEAGTYTITGPEGSKVGIWGYSTNLTDPNSTTNSCEFDLDNTGPTVRVGVTGVEGQIVLTITKYEEPTEPEPSEPEPEPSEPEPSEPEPSEPETEPSEPAESGTLITVTNENVTASGYVFEYTAATAGTLNVTVGECNPGWRYKIYNPDGSESIYRTKYSAGESCDYEGEAGNWKIVFYAYSSAQADNVDGTVSFTVTFTPSEGEGSGEVVKAEYEVSETALALGNNTLTLLDTAITTIFVFEPTETAVYTFTAPDGTILGYWGAGKWFLTNPNSTTNTYEWTCTGVGQSAYIGISGVDGEFTLTVEKTGDYAVVETPVVPYENKAELNAFTIPAGATLGGYVDVTGQTHTAVLGADGYYHLDSVDGPILLIDLNYMDIILSAALQSDRPIMYAYMYDEDGNVEYKYDIGEAIKAYEAVMDANGYYPVTEDILLFYQVYAVQAGTYTFHVTGNYNEECVWMYCMRTMTLPEPEPVYVAAVYANGQLVASYESLAEAIANCGAGQYVVLTDNVTESVTVNGDLYLDLNGYTVSGITMADDNTLFLFDSETDNYEGTYGTATVTGTVETFVTANGKTYLVVAEDGLYSAHCYAVELTYVSLDPANDALGYKAELKGDEIVCKYVTSFGFNMGVDGGLSKTYTKDFDGDKVFTLRLKGILAANGGEMTINGSAFVIFSIGEETKTVETEAHSTTMKQTLETVNANFDSYTDAQKEAVKELVTQYAAKLEGWSIDKIVAWEPSEA